MLIGGGYPAVYRPGNFSGGGATTPCAFAIGMFVSDTVWAVAIMAGFVAATFALSLMLTCLSLSLSLSIYSVSRTKCYVNPFRN